MQSSDGGWGAFDADNTRALVRELPFLDFGEVIDEPSADVTAHAIEMLGALGRAQGDVAQAGVRWLLDLQNSDGGIPTFCRGWTNLPFDRSGPDLTAHALLAWRAWQAELSLSSAVKIRDASAKAMKYLEKSQSQSGYWIPLWFGNQATLDDENPTYGTSKVLLAIGSTACKRGIDWLIAAQNRDGGWGGAAGMESSIEETALALNALAANSKKTSEAIDRGTNWLIDRIQSNDLPASPIGFYFAKLWYFEKLYPLIFTVGALSQVKQLIRLPQTAP
jgi:squalene-hopene/tetraprenyl-beta-curcumene cyclase